jgi:hypothetical protein
MTLVRAGPRTVAIVNTRHRGVAAGARGFGRATDWISSGGLRRRRAPLLDGLDVERVVVAGHSGYCLVGRRRSGPPGAGGGAGGRSLTPDPPRRCWSHGLRGVLSSLLAPIEPGFARSFVADTSSEQFPPELVDQLAVELMKVPTHVWQEMFAGLLAYDDLVEIEAITAPTLLVWADADSLVDRAMQTTLSERIRGAELLVYQGVGHTPRWQDPGRFAGMSRPSSN